MTRKLFYCELSKEADNDLGEIFDYTVEKFGKEQAIKYLSGFEDVFQNLLNNPQSGRERKEIRNGLRSISNQSHIIFYRILEDRIRIVRILHASRDIINFIPLG
jgi:toxin ParE1/3/4